MRLLTLWVPEAHIQLLDKLVEKKYYPSRSEAIRMAIRDLVLREEGGADKK